MSAAAIKRNGGNGHTGPGSSNGHSKSAATVLRKDPAALLARGYTARYLGAVLQAYNNKNSNSDPKIPSITALSNEEIDRDLRHISAYQGAAIRYHQLTYAATNHINLNAAAKNSNHQDVLHADGSGSASSSHLDPNHPSSQFFATAALPVRIDPEEEKRRSMAQKRIQRAEAVREELEQQYVALRAHYVVTTQELQSFSQESERTIETLQQCVSSTGTILGYQRAKLQMTRDVAAALQYRTNMILSREYGAAAATDAPPSSRPDDTPMLTSSQGSEMNTELTCANTSDHQFSLLEAWTALEEECKRHLSAGMTNGSKGGTAKGSKGKQAAAAAAATVIPWSCTMEPATSYGIPMLLSALSTVPEKSLAVHTGNMFGSTNKHSLTWMDSHLPSPIDEDGDDIGQAALDAIEAMRTEVATLEADLLHERQLNQETLVKTGQSRIQHDEWVAMISLVRQETEAVLYRHNVLLESDEVRDAIANMAANATLSAEAVSSTATTTMSHAQDDDEDDEEIDEDVENEDHDVDEANDDQAPVDGDGAALTADMNDRSSVTEKGSGTNKTTAATTTALNGEGASEADDEGMEEEGEDADDWDTTNNNNDGTATTTGNNKRTVGNSNANEDSEGSPGGSRKRRKV